MKKILIIGILCAFNIAYSQSEFEFTKSGFTDYIVTNFPEKSKKEIYTKTYEWILKNYKNPDSVIKSKIIDDYIKIEGFESNLFCLKSTLCTNARYTIEFSFKDGKYKFDIINIEQDMPQVGWTHFTGLEDGTFYFENNGEIKNKFKLFGRIPRFFNNLNKSIEDYINNNDKKDW